MATYNSFSGTDIHAVFGDTVFGDLQMVSYKSDREKAPVYTMGSPDPRTIARNKRLITGGWRVRCRTIPAGAHASIRIARAS